MWKVCCIWDGGSDGQGTVLVLERQTNKVFVHPLCLVIENFINPTAIGSITLLHLVITYIFGHTHQI